MNKNNPRCDVHMDQKKPFFFVCGYDYNLWET